MLFQKKKKKKKKKDIYIYIYILLVELGIFRTEDVRTIYEGKREIESEIIRINYEKDKE